MKIGPLDSGNRPYKPEEEKRQKANLRQDKPTSKTTDDSVHISKDGKRLSDSAGLSVSPSASATPKGEIKASKKEDEADRKNIVEQARQRIESGYYRDAKITEKIADRLTDEILDRKNSAGDIKTEHDDKNDNRN